MRLSEFAANPEFIAGMKALVRDSGFGAQNKNFKRGNVFSSDEKLYPVDAQKYYKTCIINCDILVDEKEVSHISFEK